MKNQPLLSVITICRNEPFIESTCRSVCGQSNQNFEWIIVDGKSTDDTLDKIAPYRPRADVFVSEADGGIYPAMNKGISLAGGKYLLFLNGGDLFYDEGTVARVLPYLNKGGAGVFYGDSYRLFARPEDCFVKSYPDELKKSFFLSNTLAHQSSFIKKDLFSKFGGYREDFSIVSDKEKWLCFLDKGVVFKHLPFVCSQFRMNGVSRFSSERLRQEKIKMLKEYYPETVLYGTDIPYLRNLFGEKQR